MSRSTDPTPVACSLGRDDLAERQARWQRLGARAAVEVVPTGCGLRLAFRRDPGVEEELRELVGLERECCGFANWSVNESGGRVVLDVGGLGDEGVAAVQAMFGTLR